MAKHSQIVTEKPRYTTQVGKVLDQRDFNRSLTAAPRALRRN